MEFDNNTQSEEGEQITIGEDGQFDVPNNPLIAVTHSDSEVWLSVQRVLDVSVDNAYSGERQVIWVNTQSSEKYPVGLNLKNNEANITSVIFSAVMMLRSIGWDKAADLALTHTVNAMKNNIIPQDSELFSRDKVEVSAFANAVVGYMEADASAQASADVGADEYDELADKFHEEFEAGAEKTAEFAQKAMEAAREQLTSAGKFTDEQGHKLKEFLENDFSRVVQEMKVGAREKLNPSRLGAGALSSMSKLLHKTGVALSGFADKADGALACKSGEITSAGKLKCNACGYEMNFKKTGRIPPCPKCHKTEFTKGY